ncbi:MAG: EF-hand domain-containing protein [Thiohalocapsa sp.]
MSNDLSMLARRPAWARAATPAASATPVIALVIACTLGPMLTASAQPPMGGPMTFGAFDQNGDGVVTEQEFTTIHEKRMAARPQQAAPMRGGFGPPTFSDFDSDGDGRMTQAEFDAGRQARMQSRRGMGSGMGQGMGPGGGRGMAMHMPTFSEFDLNGDGGLTEQEFYDARAQHMRTRAQQGFPMRNAAHAPPFETVDGDGNGVVSPDEFAAAQAEHRRQMMQQP